MTVFADKLRDRWSEGKFVCVGLDSDYWKLPGRQTVNWSPYGDNPMAQYRFNCTLIDATSHLVLAYKPNTAFYEALGSDGIKALELTMEYLHERAPDVPVILDAKRADIGNTNGGYVEFAFTQLEADAITVHPYLGYQAMKPFLDRADRGIIVLCRTSNEGAGEFQDLLVGEDPEAGYPVERLYQRVARQVAGPWNANGNCGVVVGATYPDELREVRTLVGDMPILLPGIGSQGGDVEKSLRAGLDSQGQGLVVNNSRAIIFASQDRDFATKAAEKTTDLSGQISEIRRSLGWG